MVKGENKMMDEIYINDKDFFANNPENQIKNHSIEFYRQEYPKILKSIAFDFGITRFKGGFSHNPANLNIIKDSLWLIECEETGVQENPFCIYYHESGNVYGYKTFNSDYDSFYNACVEFLRDIWGIKRG